MYITSVSCNRRFNITGWCVQRQMRACALHLFWNCAICEIHSSTKSLLITSVEGCGAGLWAGTWVIRPSVWELEFRIWSLDWANWLFLYTLKTNKNFLNQSHSRDRVVWTKRGTGGEPPRNGYFLGSVLFLALCATMWIWAFLTGLGCLRHKSDRQTLLKTF